MMACSHVRQAIPLSVPDVPLIQTTFESAVKELSPYIIRSPISGTVISEDPLQIKIDDKIKTIPLPHEVTTNKQLVTYSPIVKVNQKVKENEIIAVANEFHKKGPLTLGKTLYVAYFTTPYTFEDAVVINKSAQEALTSVSANKLQILITKDQQLISVPKSEIIERGKPIFILSHATDANVIDSDLTDFIFTHNSGRLIIRAHKNVVVKSIKVYARPNRKEELVKLGLHPIINPHLTFKGQVIDIFIEAIISWKSAAVLGDKLTNRYGTKGVISKVFEVGDVVDDTGKPVDMLINSQTVVGRKNLGQFYELYASNLVMFARDKITKMKKDEALQFLREVFGPLDNTGEKQLALAATLTTFMSTGEVVLYVPPFKEPTYSQLKTQMLKYNVKTTAKITFKQLGTTTEIEVPVGYLYIYKLMQESEKKTTARATGVYSSLGMPMKTKEAGAQSLDELSLYTLLSSNTPYLLKELHEVETIDSKARAQMIKNIIEKGSSSLLELDVTNLGNKYLNPLLNVLGISL
jgi:DNA-directed RNA polymerase beta subunit